MTKKLYYSVDEDPQRYEYLSDDMHALASLEAARITAQFMTENYYLERFADDRYKIPWPLTMYLYDSPQPEAKPLFCFSVNMEIEFDVDVGNDLRK